VKILYIGEDAGTSRHRANALCRNGHVVHILDPRSLFIGLRQCQRIIDKWVFETGGLFLETFVSHRIQRKVTNTDYDLVWVNGGELVGPELVQALRRFGARIVNYNNDDPFGDRDRNKWRVYRRAVRFYDLVVVVRESNVKEAYRLGAKRVLCVYMSADEVAHAPRALRSEDEKQWSSEVAFIGTWMPERGAFLARLIELGLPISIWGDRWKKAIEWSTVGPYWRGPGLETDAYAKAVQHSKICLGLVSKGNRDLSTTRSFEIPYLGGLLCAERTTDHLELYVEGDEAVFWSDADECAEICKQLLQDAKTRKRIAASGRIRAIQNGHLNQNVTQRILREIVENGG
jgi:spore maturation protein CgeB